MIRPEGSLTRLIHRETDRQHSGRLRLTLGGTRLSMSFVGVSRDTDCDCHSGHDAVQECFQRVKFVCYIEMT